jgi:hypothetical protein
MKFKIWLEAQWRGIGRQKQFAFMNQPENPWQRHFNPDKTEKIDEYDSRYLYHVTTQLNKVLADQRLKSRKELGGFSGLGGGPNYEAPNKISLTYNFDRASSIYHEFHFVLDIVAGKIKASQIFDRFNYINDDYYYNDSEELTSVDNVIADYVPKKYILDGETNKIHAILDGKIKTPKQKYEFFQELEKAVVEHEKSKEYENFEPWSVMGFTSSFEQMQKIDPNQLAILQVVIRKNANIEHIPGELEIRVFSKDVTIIKYLKP